MGLTSTERTLVGGLFTLDLEAPLANRLGQLAAKGFGFTLAAFLIPWALEVPFCGLISVFLVAASLRDPMVTLLDENRDRIWGAGVPAAQANRRTTVSVLAMFLGALAGYSGIAVWLGPEAVVATFGVVVDAVTITADVSLLEGGHFGSSVGILGHNLSVMVAIFAIASLYRAYGAMLVLCWNAAVWATVLFVLTTQAVKVVTQPAPVVFLGTAAGVLPHLTTEALGYCTAAIAAIFSSLALSKYGLSDPRLRTVMGSVARMLLVALGLLISGALLEAHLAPRVLGLLSPR